MGQRRTLWAVTVTVCLLSEWALAAVKQSNDNNNSPCYLHQQFVSHRMCIMSPVGALRPYVLLEFCKHAVWTLPHHWQSTDWLSSPSWRTPSVRGGGGSPVQLDQQWLEAFIRRSDRSGFVPAVCPILQTSAWQLTRSYLRQLSEITITFYIHICHCSLRSLNTWDLRQRKKKQLFSPCDN